jgi:hypothetical protein
MIPALIQEILGRDSLSVEMRMIYYGFLSV